ncbi:MAG: AAA family ATPase [Candidatus Methylumidiphilus sp.]
MTAVSSLTIVGYKSIRDLSDFKLNDLNVLIGANGAGKSNLISLFRLLNEMYEQNLQVYVQTQGGPDALLHFGRNTTEQLHAEFYFGLNGYQFDLIPTADNRLIFKTECTWFGGGSFFKPIKGNYSRIIGSGNSESKLKTSDDTYAEYIRPAISRWLVYHFHDASDTAKVKQKHPANDNLSLKTDAANLAAYLLMLRKKHEAEYQRIVDAIRLVAPFFGDFVHRLGEPDYVELEWTQRGKPDTPFKAHILSDGTLRFICLATLLLQPVELIPDTILIDEPELGLHPYAISVLADIFKQVSSGWYPRQLIVSTQSVELVNELSPEDVIVVDYEDDASIFRRFSQDELSGWLEEYSMGELWKCNILGGRP